MKKNKNTIVLLIVMLIGNFAHSQTSQNLSEDIGKKYVGIYVESYIYTGAQCNSSLEISYIKSKVINFILNTGCSEGCTGDVSGKAYFSNQYEAKYNSKDCKLTFTFKNNQVIVTEDCTTYHGMNCTFNGTYKKK